MSASGKVSIVFGGARGVGEACAARLLKERAKVCIADVQADLGAATCKRLEVTYPGSVIFVSCDITDDKQIEDVFSAASEKFGSSVEICVNTAAIADEVNWKRTVQVNLVGSMSVTYIAQQRMGTQNGNKGGHVILLSSIAGVIHPMTYAPCYATTKAALIGFVRSVGVEEGLTVDGVRVNAILPNLIIDTPFASGMTATQRYPQAQDKLMAVINVTELNGITTTMVADAMMKLVEEKDLNGATLLFTKDGIQPFDESERSQKIMEMLYVNESKESKL